MFSSKTLVPVYYSAMHQLHNPPHEHDRGFQIPYHEVPRRIEAAKEALEGLPFTQLETANQSVPDSILFAVHETALVTYLKQASCNAAAWQAEHPEQGEVYITTWIYPLKSHMRQGLLKSSDPSGCFAFDVDAPIGVHSWEAIQASAELAFSAAAAVRNGEIRLAYALCRPPGHHAGPDYTGGYCYLNNAAIAAQTLLPLGSGAILDIDYHHGNGTQDIFWQRKDILYVSIHADPNEEYPLFAGFTDETGGEEAPGWNLNLPLPMGSGDEAYREALETALQTIQDKGANWLVLSAGFDTCADDPTSSFTLSDSLYSYIGEKIRQLNLPVVVVHEGGYAVEANGRLAARLLTGLRGSE
jgi:acetoin utilization deacetylase AcuC-like enzyme